MYLSYSMRSNNLGNIGVTAIGRKLFGSVGRATFGIGLILDILKKSGRVRESKIRLNNQQMGSAKVSAAYVIIQKGRPLDSCDVCFCFFR